MEIISFRCYVLREAFTTNASDNTILDLVKFFNEETETGKIYFSYPMVEAIKHMSSSIDFQNLKVSATVNINYKGLVSNDGANHLKDLGALSEDNWKEIFAAHLKKMNFIVNDTYTFPSSLNTQLEIFLNQLSKYIQVDATVAVLSAFPVFVLDYYGVSKTTKIITNTEEEE